MAAGDGAEYGNKAHHEQAPMKPLEKGERALGGDPRAVLEPAIQEQWLGDEQHEREQLLI